MAETVGARERGRITPDEGAVLAAETARNAEFGKPVLIYPNLYLVRVPLPHNPLHALNSYFILDDDGTTTIVDVGFNHPDCEQALSDAPGRPRALLGQGAGGAHPFASRPHGQPRPHLARGHAGAREPALLPRGEEPHGDGGQRLWSGAPSSGHFRAAARHDLRRGGAAICTCRRSFCRFPPTDHDVSGRWRLPESRRVRVRGDRDAGPRSLAHLPLRGRPQDPPVRRSCSGAHHAVGIVVVFCLQRIGGVPG